MHQCAKCPSPVLSWWISIFKCNGLWFHNNKFISRMSCPAWVWPRLWFCGGFHMIQSWYHRPLIIIDFWYHKLTISESQLAGVWYPLCIIQTGFHMKWPMILNAHDTKTYRDYTLQEYDVIIPVISSIIGTNRYHIIDVSYDILSMSPGYLELTILYEAKLQGPLGPGRPVQKRKTPNFPPKISA